MQNKGIIITLIVLLTIIAITLISIMILGMTNKDNNYKISFFGFGNKTKTLFQNEYDINEIKSININADSTNVRFKEGSNDKMKVTILGLKDEKFNVNLQESELSISKENKVFRLMFFTWVDEEILIELPQNYNPDTQIRTTSGNVNLIDLEETNAQIEVSSGNITCGNLHNANIRATSGNIEMANGNDVTLKTTSGNITTGNIENGIIQLSSGNVRVGEIATADIKVTSGNIKVEKVNRIVGATTSGNITIGDINSFCNLSCSSGSVNINNCIIDENSTIRTTSGVVKISKIDNAYIDTKTSSGSVKVENNDRKSDIVLNIQTTSGSIRVN